MNQRNRVFIWKKFLGSNEQRGSAGSRNNTRVARCSTHTNMRLSINHYMGKGVLIRIHPCFCPRKFTKVSQRKTFFREFQKRYLAVYLCGMHCFLLSWDTCRRVCSEVICTNVFTKLWHEPTLVLNESAFHGVRRKPRMLIKSHSILTSCTYILAMHVIFHLLLFF